MADPEHLELLKKGFKVWNSWRKENPTIEPDLTGARLTGTYLTGADLTGTYLTGADLTGARMSDTILANVDLSEVHGLDKVVHVGPSSIGIDTIFRSKGKIPEVFLRGAGVPEMFIQYIPSLVEQPIQFYSVFISYSHADKPFARQLHDRLQGRGIRCWLDEHQLLPGQKIHVEVDRGIRQWDKVLLCCSQHSLTSWWVNNEIELAIQKEQRLWKERGEEVLALIPLNLDGYMFNPEWHSGWKGQITERLAADFTGWEHSHVKFEEQLERVVKALMTDDRGRTITPPSRL